MPNHVLYILERSQGSESEIASGWVYINQRQRSKKKINFAFGQCKPVLIRFGSCIHGSLSDKVDLLVNKMRNNNNVLVNYTQ